MLRRLLTASLVLVAALAPAPARAQSGPANCSIVSQNSYVRDALHELYLWYRELPNLDPARYDSPEAYLEAVRYRPLDTHFSYITGRAASDAFYSDSQFIGIGLSIYTTTSEMRVSQVFPDSPASEAGLARGDRIVSIDGRTIAELAAAGLLGSAFGPSEIGVSVDLVFEHPDGARVGATVVKRLVTIPTVSLTQLYEVDGRTVAYIFFRNFVRPSRDALDRAFAEVKAAGASELVLDLRYNGGGLVSVAQHLASLIGGAPTSGQVFASYRHNDQNGFRDEDLRFTLPPNALGLTRLIVIATPSTASASELVVNGLRPFLDVVVVGDRTYGKPVGQYLLPFCDKVLAPVAFSMRNANDEGDYFDGLPATCHAADDLDRQLGDPAEASLAEALTYVRTGACSAAATSLGVRGARPDAPRPLRATGWRSLLNAY